MSTATINAAASGTFTLGGDLKVNRLGFGTMRLTGSGIWGEPKDSEEARRVLRRAVELGVNLIDTADSYGPEVSERLIAEALYPYRKDLVIATKGGFTRQGPDQWAPVGRAEYLRQQLEMSLRRLRLERIELYQLHRIDPRTPLGESLGAMKEFQAQGKIRHIGLSEVTPQEIEQARKIAPIVSVQNLYNLSDRKHEAVLQILRQAQFGLHPVVSSCIRQARARGDRCAGRDRAATRNHRSAAIHRMAAAPFAGGVADSRNFVRGAPGREHCSRGSAPR